jgi:hypothetical protein
MTAEDLWTTARRLLGVYFIVTGLIALPGVVTLFEANSGVTMVLVSEPWSSGTVSITQAAVEFTAGLLLVTRPSAISTWMADRRAAG